MTSGGSRYVTCSLHLGATYTGTVCVRENQMHKHTLCNPLFMCVRTSARAADPSAVAMATHVRARHATSPAWPIAGARFPVFTKALWERLARQLCDAGGRHSLVLNLLPPSLFPTIL